MQPKTRGQAMVEFALISPLLFLMMALLIDFGRLIYAFGAIASAAEQGARIVSLHSQQSSDCLAFQRMESVGKAFPLGPDPASTTGNGDPNPPPDYTPGPTNQNPTTPTPGQGLIYIYPAVALGSPNPGLPDAAANCGGDGNPRLTASTARDVEVEITYEFVPITPIVSAFIPGFRVYTVSTTRVAY